MCASVNQPNTQACIGLINIDQFSCIIADSFTLRGSVTFMYGIVLARLWKVNTNIILIVVGTLGTTPTRMWANAQPDGRPAEHRWRPVFNAAKFG